MLLSEIKWDLGEEKPAWDIAKDISAADGSLIRVAKARGHAHGYNTRNGNYLVLKRPNTTVDTYTPLYEDLDALMLQAVLFELTKEPSDAA